MSTISEGSECSYISEIDDSVWKINDEQRHYYVTQFKKLQPNEKGLIKGNCPCIFLRSTCFRTGGFSIRIWHQLRMLRVYTLSFIKGPVSFSMPCTCCLLVGLCLSPFSWAVKMATN